MGTYKLIVFSDPVEGEEAAYNAWYDDVHLADVVAVPGVGSALRLKALTPGAGGFDSRHMAIFDFETDDPEAVLAGITRRSGTPAMPLSNALDMATFRFAIFKTGRSFP